MAARRKKFILSWFNNFNFIESIQKNYNEKKRVLESECSLLTKALKDKRVKYIERKLVIYDTGERVKLNFENGGMKKLVNDYLKIINHRIPHFGRLFQLELKANW